MQLPPLLSFVGDLWTISLNRCGELEQEWTSGCCVQVLCHEMFKYCHESTWLGENAGCGHTCTLVWTRFWCWGGAARVNPDIPPSSSLVRRCDDRLQPCQLIYKWQYMNIYSCKPYTNILHLYDCMYMAMCRYCFCGRCAASVRAGHRSNHPERVWVRRRSSKDRLSVSGITHRVSSHSPPNFAVL